LSLCNLLLYQHPPAFVLSQMKHCLPAFFTCSFAQHVKHKYCSSVSKLPGLRRYRPLFWRFLQFSPTQVFCGPLCFFFESSLSRCFLSSGTMGTIGMTFPEGEVVPPLVWVPTGCVFSSSSPNDPIAACVVCHRRVKNRAKKTRERARIESKEREKRRVRGHTAPFI